VTKLITVNDTITTTADARISPKQTFFISRSIFVVCGKCSMKRSFTEYCKQQAGVKTAAVSPSVTTSSSNDNEHTAVQPAGSIDGDEVLQQSQQESLANAKVSATALVYKMHLTKSPPPLRIAQQYQRNLYSVEKYFQCATIPSMTMRVYLHSFSRCCLPNMPTST